MGPAIFWEILGRHLGILLDVWGDLGETFRYTFGCLGRLVFGEQSEPYMLTYNTIVRTTCVGPDGACDFLGILGIYLGIYLGRLFRNYILRESCGRYTVVNLYRCHDKLKKKNEIILFLLIDSHILIVS